MLVRVIIEAAFCYASHSKIRKSLFQRENLSLYSHEKGSDELQKFLFIQENILSHLLLLTYDKY